MAQRRPIFLRVLAHQHRDHHERCLWLPLGPYRLALCSRCTGLYPTLALALGLQLSLGAPRQVSLLDWLGGLFLAAPALLDWGASRLRWPGHNALRFVTGVLLGIALGRGFYLYFFDPLGPLLWIQLGLLGIGALAFEVVRQLDFSEY